MGRLNYKKEVKLIVWMANRLGFDLLESFTFEHSGQMILDIRLVKVRL